jgi:hypothetical protein
MKLMKVKVDNQDVSNKIIRQSTSQPFIFDVPQNNVYQMKAPLVGKHPTMGESYYLFFKPLPIGHSNVEPSNTRPVRGKRTSRTLYCQLGYSGSPFAL